MSVGWLLFVYSSFVSTFLDPTYKLYHMIFVSVWLTALSMAVSRFVHLAAKGIISWSFTAK